MQPDQQRWRRRQRQRRRSSVSGVKCSIPDPYSLTMAQGDVSSLMGGTVSLNAPFSSTSLISSSVESIGLDMADTLHAHSPSVSGRTISKENTSGDDRSLWNEKGSPTAKSQQASSLFHPYSGEDGEAKDAKIMQAFLVKAFPQSLKHIAADEGSIDAVLSNNASNAADSGYHRQFTELVLLEVYGLLMRTVDTFERRRKYLRRRSVLETGEMDCGMIDRLATEEGSKSLSEWDKAWYKPGPPDTAETLIAVTARPPEFVAGMLWDGCDRFLLGGTAFLEEGRILQVRVQGGRNVSEGEDSAKNSRKIGVGEEKAQVRMLLREFVSVSKVGMGCMVQTFSLIPDNVSVATSRSQTLRYGLIQGVLDQCLSGAVSRAFSLQVLLPASIRSGLDNANGDLLGSHITLRTQEEEEDANTDSGLRFSHSSFNWSKTGERRISLSTVKSRPPAVRNAFRRPLGDEAYLRFTNPKLYAWVMQHTPAVLTVHTNAIREYLLYGQRLRFCRQMKRLLYAVYTIQRFFRHSLKRKRSAVQRMIRQWRQLELKSLEHLKKFTIQPTTTDRISFIVGTVLWQHILTTEAFKKEMLEELFTTRRASYWKWSAQRREESGLGVEFQDVTFLTNDGSVMDPDAGAAQTKKLHQKWFSRWGDVLHRRFGWYIEPEYLLQESHRRMLISLRKSICMTVEVQEELRKRCGETFLALN